MYVYNYSHIIELYLCSNRYTRYDEYAAHMQPTLLVRCYFEALELPEPEFDDPAGAQAAAHRAPWGRGWERRGGGLYQKDATCMCICVCTYIYIYLYMC